MSTDQNYKFVCSYKTVTKCGTYHGHFFFAKADGGLHLNTEGSNRLGYFYLRVIYTTD